LKNMQIISAEKQIPFPLQSSENDIPKSLAFRSVGNLFASLQEVGPLTAPGYCELLVGPGPDAAIVSGLNIHEGRLLFMLAVHQLQRGKAPDDALEIASILMMYRQST
jgi:hypothetical protein